MIRTGEYYRFPAEVWDEKRCKKEVKHVGTDGMGTKHPRPGYIGSSMYPGGFCRTRYNGGCVHGGDWYEGEIRPLPKLAKGFRITRIRTWGWYIVKVEKNESRKD